MNKINDNKKITILIPVYNEEKNIENLIKKLNTVVADIKPYLFEYVFVDDGSKDNSVNILENASKQDKRIKVIELSRNFGKEIALTSGLHHINSDALIIMDADLQHPPELIPQFIHEWENGFEIVATKRLEIQNRSFGKRLGSSLFYRIMNLISETQMEAGTTDYRLIDKKVIDILKSFTERNRMVRGLIDWMGFKKTFITFKAPDRMEGVAGYGYRKLFKLAVDSLTSFSLFPLRFAGYLGLFITTIAGLLLLYMIVAGYLLKVTIFTPLAFVVVANTLLIGIVLMSLGLVALYIGNIHVEVVNRPLFIIRTKINFEDDFRT